MMQAPAVAAVIVTYNADLLAFSRLLSALRPQVGLGVVVDNGSHNEGKVRAAADKWGLEFIALGVNKGIAAAQNRGIEWAARQGATHLLLSDQDSLPAPNMVEELLAALNRAEFDSEESAASSGDRARVFPRGKSTDLVAPRGKSPAPVAAVGPVPLDERGDDRGDASEALVYSFTTWGPKRRSVPGPSETLEVPFVLASGCLIPMSVLADVGPMNESLFIDHVDLAWCLRAVELGYRILVAGDALLYHSLGDEVAKLPGSQRMVHLHSPIRNYYIMRNTLFLQRATFLPAAWKAGYLVWMAKYMGYYLLLAPGRGERLSIFASAVRDGISGRGGPYRSDGR